MGALTSNRKHRDDWFGLSRNQSSPYSSDFDWRADFRISKKPRISSGHSSPERSVSSRITASRISQYPDQISRLRREVHAPCREKKFLHSASSVRESYPETDRVGEKQESIDEMGNFLNRRYDETKTSALAVLQHLIKGKAPVIDVEAQCSKDVISDDSSVEELEILDDEREGRSVVSDQRYREANGNVSLQDAHAKRLVYGSSFLDETDFTPKVDDSGKMMDSPSVSGEAEAMGLPAYKKLLESVKRLNNPKLSFLGSQIKFFETKRSFFSKLLAKKPEEDVLPELFAPLKDDEKAEVSRAFSGSNRGRVLTTHENSNIEITGEVLTCLSPGAWLNDEVINLYFELLKEREKREPKKFLKCHFFNTFFYKKLYNNVYDFKAVRRWTTQRKIGYGLVECDKIFVPIHKTVHWCLAVINKKDEKFQYLDSLKGQDPQVLEVLARYFKDEVKDKSGEDIDVSSWEHEYVGDLPEQENGYDCGMFMIKYADFYSRGLKLCFKQEHMPYFRQRTAKEILHLKAE